MKIVVMMITIRYPTLSDCYWSRIGLRIGFRFIWIQLAAAGRQHVSHRPMVLYIFPKAFNSKNTSKWKIVTNWMKRVLQNSTNSL